MNFGRKILLEDESFKAMNKIELSRTKVGAIQKIRDIPGERGDQQVSHELF